METDIYFGTADKSEVDWRDVLKNEIDPDDDGDYPTEQWIIDILGFNPDDINWGKEEEG